MMTGYLVFADQASAVARSQSEATARGCKAGDVTKYWWPVVPHPTVAGQFLMLLDDSRPPFAKAMLQTAEKASVQTSAAVLTGLATATGQAQLS